MLDIRHKILDENSPPKRGGIGVLSFVFFLFISSCGIQKEVVVEQQNESFDLISHQTAKIQTYTGWWVYGEGQHIFKDEETLEEFDLVFPNENMEELVALYLAVCEMEYFPMECEMTGSTTYIDGLLFLQVSDFEILYIQGCGE